jgi:hypothetical protein
MADDRRFTKRRAALAAAAGLAVVLGVGFVGCGRPPQMGADEAVFRTVDALFTAVTARDAKLLGQCEQRLRAQREVGKLPPAASDYLDGVIAKARAGRWESSAERLYDFMTVQRREGERDRPARVPTGHGSARVGPR